MAKDKALGSTQDDDAIFEAGSGSEDQSEEPSSSGVEAADDDDDSSAVSEAIHAQGRGDRPDLKEISAAIKGVRLGPAPLKADAQPAPAEAPADGPPAPKSDSVPLATFLEVERELRELRRQASQPARAQPAQAPAESMDDLLYTNPTQFVQRLNQTFEQRIAAVQLNHDLERASDRNADVWEPAWSSFMQRVDGGRDPALYQSVMNARSPGQAIADWYRTQQTLSEVGTDPKAYRERILQEALSDDAFVSQIAQRLGLDYDAPQPRGQRPAAPQRAPNGQFQPASVTRLPTSLSRLSGRAAEADGDDGDGSEEAIFNAGRTRRR